MPLGKYKDFADCVAKNRNKKDPNAYCGQIYHQIEGKKRELIKRLEANTKASILVAGNILEEEEKYITIKRGKVKKPVGSPMDRYLHWKGLPHSHVEEKGGKKKIKRVDT